MYEQNGIMYADNPAPLITVKQVCPLDDYQLLVRFSTGEEKKLTFLLFWMSRFLNHYRI